MQSFAGRLKGTDVLLADGAMGTILFKRGLKPGDCPEKINIQNPEILEDIARSYLLAGAEIIQTNTFGGSPLKLAAYGLEIRTEEINSRAVSAVRSAVGDHVFVSASVGPSGKILEPYGDTSPEVVFNSFLRQLKAIIAEGVDLVCIETMTDLAEAKLAIEAAKSIARSLPVAATMTFDETPRGYYTLMGSSIEKAAAGLSEAGADIIGSNCGNGILTMIKIASEFMQHTKLPVIIQSNAGIPALKNGVSVFPYSPDFMSEKSRQLLEKGVKILGGCCGTTPDHTASLRKIVDEFNRSKI